MTGIGEQIKNARKAKGMTQDALAEILHVTRAAVANWEQGRRLPDAETLLQLSKALEYSFEAENSLQSGNPAESSTEGAAGSPDGTPAASGSGFRWRLSPKTMIALASVIVILIAGILVLPLLTSRKTARERYYKSPVDGTVYTIERFQQETSNKAGSAYLRVEPSLRINHGENYDFWMFDFNYLEMNGIPLAVNRVEQVFFSKDKENVELVYSAADLSAYGMQTEIPAYGEWVYSGGLPVQDSVLGVGVLLRCTDANGTALIFTDYIPFPAA